MNVNKVVTCHRIVKIEYKFQKLLRVHNKHWRWIRDWLVWIVL